MLRPATPADAGAAAPLIREAGPPLFDRLFGPRPEDAVRFFEWLFAQSGVPFSHQAALLAVRGGEIVGLALAMPAAARRRNSWRMLYLLPRRRGLWTLLRLAPVVHAFRNASAPPPPDCYYLSILAVRADERGAGHRRPAAGRRRSGGRGRRGARRSACTPNGTTPGRGGSMRGTVTR